MPSKWPITFTVDVLERLEETPGEVESAIYAQMDHDKVDDDAMVLQPIKGPEGFTTGFLCRCSNIGTSIRVRRAVLLMRQASQL